MGEVKRYDEERDIMQLDILGGYYGRHVSAMTSEGLHRKSAIAAELGYRDSVIDALRAENAELVAALERLSTPVGLTSYGDALANARDLLAKHRGD